MAENQALDSSSSSSVNFVCNIVENRLEYQSSRSQEIAAIAIDDIVCILPDSEQGHDVYQVLFLQADSAPQRDNECLASILMTSIPSKLLSQYLVTNIPGHLKSFSNEEVDIHVVISTLSGMGLAKTVFQNVLRPFLTYLGLTEFNVYETQSAQTIIELTRSTFLPRAKIGISQTIILLSGDGGLIDLIDAFYSSAGADIAPPNIVLIPSGTGNAMANSIGLLARPASALIALLQGNPTPIPPFSVAFSPGAQYITDYGRGRSPVGINPKIYGAVVASWGIHAALVADSDTAEYRIHGVDRFKMVAEELLFPSGGAETHKYNGEITLFKSDSRGKLYLETMEPKKHMYVLATLVSSLEKGFVINPRGSPLDGQLRMVHFGPIPSEEAMRLMGLAYQGGKHVHEDAVTYTEVDGLRIDFHEDEERWRRVCVDGKIIAVEQGGWVEVRQEPRRLLNLVTCTDYPMKLSGHV